MVDKWMDIYKGQRRDVDVQRESREGRAAPHMNRGADLELALNVLRLQYTILSLV